MTRLVLKIFLAYWLAAGVVIAVSDFGPNRNTHRPELVDALESSLLLNGRMAVDVYGREGCAQLQKLADQERESLSLAKGDGSFVCGQAPAEDATALARKAAASGKRATARHPLFQLVAVPVQSLQGEPFVVVMKSDYKTALQVNGLLPGSVTITISGVVTLFLAFLLALPIRRLRTAAQKIAMGDLQARVKWGTVSARIYGLQGKDDIARLVADFNNMAERLQMLADAQRLLLRDVSHELRSPLARLRVGLGLARMDSPKSADAHLDRIEMEANRLNELIGQIIALSSMGTVDGLGTKSEVDLSELVEGLLPDIEYEAEQNGCTVERSIAQGCYMHGDADLLRSAIDNILRNALLYVPSGGLIELEVEVRDEEGGEFAVVRVSDNGPGIPEGELQSVLEPFYRADRSRHWKQEGFGIGLAIANRAAAIHGGTIEMRNREGGGLVVELTFPASVVAGTFTLL